MLGKLAACVLFAAAAATLAGECPSCGPSEPCADHETAKALELQRLRPHLAATDALERFAAFRELADPVKE